MKLGILVRNRNKRRRSKRIELDLRERVILKTRILVEHKFAQYKQYKRLHTRVDRSLAAFKTFVFLASLIFIDK
jgi:transposase